MSIRTVGAGVLVTVIEWPPRRLWSVTGTHIAGRVVSAFIERGWREGLRSRRWACRALEK